MSKCLKTGIDLWLPQYGAFVRTDLHATEESFICTVVIKDRFIFRDPEGFVATVDVTDECFWQFGVMVIDPRMIEFSDPLEQHLGELAMEEGVKIPGSVA